MKLKTVLRKLQENPVQHRYNKDEYVLAKCIYMGEWRSLIWYQSAEGYRENGDYIAWFGHYSKLTDEELVELPQDGWFIYEMTYEKTDDEKYDIWSGRTIEEMYKAGLSMDIKEVSNYQEAVQFVSELVGFSEQWVEENELITEIEAEYDDIDEFQKYVYCDTSNAVPTGTSIGFEYHQEGEWKLALYEGVCFA